MKRFKIIIAMTICCSVYTTVTFANKQARPVLAIQPCGIAEDVKENIRFRVEHGYNIGIVVGIVSPGGNKYYSYGKTALSGSQKPNEDTIFEIGSFTKVFTSLLLAEMAQRGRVALEDPIGKFLPGRVRTPKRNGKSITLAHLATHTSGLPRLPDDITFSNPSNPYADYTVEQMYDFLSGHTLTRDIGEKYEYSNYGVGLLGHILALSNGTNYEKLVKQRITNRLGMRNTGVNLTADMGKRLAKGHSGNIEVSNWDIPTLAGAGALRSSARDMLRFLAANIGLKKSRLYSAMRTTHEPRYEADSPVMHIGLGWHILAIDDRQIIWHNGGTGGYWSFAGFVSDQQKGVVVLTNSNQTIDDIGFHLLDPNIPLNPLDPNFSPGRAKLMAEPVNVDLAAGEKLPTGNEIMQRFIKCIGGHDALARTKNRLLKATMEIKQLGVKGTITTYQTRPNKYYTKIDLAGLMVTEQGTDGRVVWELSSMTGGKIHKGEERAAMLLHCRFDDMNYEQLYKKIECVGIEKIGEDACYKVVFTPKQATAFTSYFSRASGLMVKIAYQFGQIKVESFMSDYRKVDGILHPYQVIEKVMNIDTYYTVESLEHNVEMPANRFEPPAKIKNLLERSKEE